MDLRMMEELTAASVYGLTLVSDGFTDTSRQSLLNVMLASREKSWYFTNSNSSREEKTMTYIAEFVHDKWMSLDVALRDSVHHVCLDGACVGAFNAIEAKLPRSLCTICTAT
ncbi:hypothetical protein DIPPA_23858 [Diplonema papillatum]|nr:hypothetical protein DIPPA_23858 [Diplonema papillatum]